MKDEPVIQTRGLTKYFGAKCAVRDLNLEVPRGGVFAFLGRNGSGKSTTIRMLLGLVRPDRGGARVLGCESTALTPELRSRIGYLTEEHQLYGWMSVRQAGEFQSAFFPRWNEKIFRGVIGHFGLKPEARIKHLSRACPGSGPRSGGAPLPDGIDDLPDPPLGPDDFLFLAQPE